MHNKNQAAHELAFQINDLKRWLRIYKNILSPEEIKRLNGVLKGLRDLQVGLRLAYLQGEEQ